MFSQIIGFKVMNKNILSVMVALSIASSFSSTAFARQVSGVGEFATSVLDTPDERGYEIAKQRAMSEAAQNSVKYVESIESLSTKNDVRKFQRDVSVISPALLSNVETSKTSFLENGKKVFRVTVEANFDEDHSRQIKSSMDAVGHQTNLMHDLMVTQDEIKNINYRLSH